ncbi:cytochrome P450 [Streptomyces sp. NBC_00669]|uniref:cytochrome P450 n=1 Tax=unclassified Streptomyces TaxID=2593676 RepID=UPI002E329353|nr:cytochrome P450 [Streptomyces sp. NBC_00669]
MKITSSTPDDDVDLATVDLFDPGRYRDGCQHAAWRTLRRHAPVWRQHAAGGTPFWSVTRHADCGRVLRDTETFSSEHGTILASVGVGDPAGGQTITLMDPPEHGEVRMPAMRLLSRSGVERRTARIRERIDDLTASFVAAGGGDFAEVGRRLPMAMFGDLMGVPEPLWEEIGRWAAVSIAPEEPEYAVGATVQETMLNAHHELFDLFTEALRHRRRDPGDDLLTVLSSLTVRGRHLTMREIVLNCYSYVLGAHSTTPHVAGHVLHILTQQPELSAAVRADHRLLPALVEEGTRWTSPTHHLIRRATRDTELAGVRVRAGDWVCAWVASANRDEDVFEDPYRFRIDRRSHGHLGFGAGPHFCVGTHLSRAALVMLLTRLLRPSAVVEAVGEPTHLYSNWINGLTHLPIGFRG